MQTFLPYPDYEKSARCLDNKRLGKQRVESYQILKTLACGRIQHSLTEKRGFKYDNGLYLRKTPWYNHPATKMWKGCEWALFDYTVAICKEWIRRGFEDTVYDKIDVVMSNFPLPPDLTLITGTQTNYPKWFNCPELFASHRSNLLRKNPVWYEQFNWSEFPNMEYWWPTKNGY